MMKLKKIIKRGRHYVLPLIGDVVSELCLSIEHTPTLVFRDAVYGDSQLQVEEAITLIRGNDQLQMTGSRPGTTFDPQTLHPLVGLLGTTVVDALAHDDGSLDLAFSNGWALVIRPDNTYEGWHFQYPRPGRPVGGDLNRHVSMHGADGYLC